MERKKLTVDEIQVHLTDLPEWRAEEDHLKRRFTFANFADSLAFVERARRAVAAGGDVPLRELLARADAELGPFTSMPNELAATLRAIVREQGKEPVA